MSRFSPDFYEKALPHFRTKPVYNPIHAGLGCGSFIPFIPPVHHYSLVDGAQEMARYCMGAKSIELCIRAWYLFFELFRFILILKVLFY